MKKFGTAIKNKRNKLGLKQIDFCVAIGVSQAMVSKIELNKTIPNALVLFKISETLKISGNEIFELLKDGEYFL